MSNIQASNNKREFLIIHIIDGTYELLRHFYGQRRFNKGKDKPFGAAVGVLNGVLQMIEEGATHLGVATPNHMYIIVWSGQGVIC